MRVVSTNALTHRKKDPGKCLHEAETGENQMYLEACLQQSWHFSPFVASLDRLMGVETTANLKRIASSLANDATNGEKCQLCWRQASRDI